MMGDKTFSEREVNLLKEIGSGNLESTYDILLRLTERTLNCEHDSVDWTDWIDYEGEALVGVEAGGVGISQHNSHKYTTTWEGGMEHGFQIYEEIKGLVIMKEMRNGKESGLTTYW